MPSELTTTTAHRLSPTETIGQASASPLRITTLGDDGRPNPEIRAANGGVLGPGKPFALLVYLACSPRCTASRDQLVDLLWADIDPASGRHALRQATWYVRKRLGERVIDTDGSGLTLGAPFTMDRDRVIACADAGDYAGAVTAYTGEFLSSFAVPGGGEFDRWAELERQRLRALFVRCAEVQARNALAEGRQKEAQAVARRARDADPFNQSAWRLVLESLVSANDVLGAATEADRLVQLLQDEEIEPEPATRAAITLARDLRAPSADSGTDAPERNRGLVIDLIGREREFGRLLAGWESARGGTAVHLHVVAPAGLGKTRIVKDLYARLRAMRSRVVLVRANSGERTIPCAAAADVAAALAALPGAAGLAPAAAAALVALNPSLSSVYCAEPDTSTGDEAMRRRSLALADLARSVAEDAPLAILVDDVHWADDASRQLLAGAAPRLRDARILLVSASRPMPSYQGARGLREDIRLEPLTVAQVQEFVTNVARLPDDLWSDALASALHAATNGSPLLLLETLQLAIERGVLRVSDNAWLCDQPADLAELLRAGSAVDRRIAPLERAEAWCLLVLAVAGMPLPFEAVGGLGANAVEGLQELERRGLAQRTVSGWLPEHDEIADAAVRRASSELVKAAHLKLGQALAPLLAVQETLRPVVTRHLLEGDDRDALQALFVEQVRRLRGRGDRRSTRRIAESFLGHGTPGLDASALASGVPWRLKARTRWIGAAALAFVALAAVGIGAKAWKETAPVDVWIVGYADGRPVAQPIAPEAWRTGVAVDLGATRAQAFSAPTETMTARGLGLVPIGDGRWALTKESADSGGVDIYLREKSGATRRLTDHPADDAVDDVSRDGTTLLIESGRWTPSERNNVGLLDLRTGRITRLVVTEDLAGGGRWSPDGTRIAYARTHYTPHAPELCVVSVDGTGDRCKAYAGAEAVVPLAWRDAHTLLVDAKGDTARALMLVDARSFEERRIADARQFLKASGDGRFVLAAQRSAPGQSDHLVVIDVEHPHRPILLTSGGSEPKNAALGFVDGNQSVATPYLARVRILVPHDGAPVDLPQQLQVEATDATGGSTTAEVLTWRSLDTLVAVISPDGLLTPRVKGWVRIVASAGGWRADTARIAIVAPQASRLLVEDWARLDSTRWVPFGQPVPVVGEVRGHGALLVNGDSSFSSGVHERGRHLVGDGLAVHAEISLRRNAPQWQTLSVVVFAPDSAALAAWNHRTGSEPIGFASQYGLSLPGGEGYPASTKGEVITPSSGSLIIDAQWAMGGEWVPLDVQVFPDGTCGVALNGKPVTLSRGFLDPRSRVMVHLQGKSWHTTSAVGRTEVWSGVRPGIDWSRLRAREGGGVRTSRRGQP